MKFGFIFFKILVLSAFTLNGISVCAQSKVAITIDDVPNTRLYAQDGFDTRLLAQLDALQVPTAIFINEFKMYQNDSIWKNMALLNAWISNSYITVGNHSFKHSRYSISGLDSFKIEVVKGEAISRELALKNHKSLQYFRFPFNDLGKDSVQQKEIAQYLNTLNYTITPFTIESSDWMYNYVYRHYLKQGEHKKAREVGMRYVEQTLAMFTFFEKLSNELYGRNINHIYLCHDNWINRDFLTLILEKLQAQKYQCVSLDEAMEDQVYQQPNLYHKKWGISWLYRWMETQEERYDWMKQEPDFKRIHSEYEALVKLNSK